MFPDASGAMGGLSGSGMPGSGAGMGTGAGTPPGTAPPGATGAPATAPGTDFASAEGPGFGGAPTAAEGSGGTFAMIGNQSPYRLRAAVSPSRPPQPPPIPPPPSRSQVSPALYPSLRSFRICENMSPRPQDRVFFNFNYFTNVNESINRSDGIPIRNMTAYRYIFGVEKTFFDMNASVGLRLPLNTLTADGLRPNISTPTRTALGNLSVFGKFVLLEDRSSGSLISAGLAITPPTGPSRFAEAPYVVALNNLTFQPFLGFIWRADRLYFQGFSAVDVPVTDADVTLFYNDLGVGYYVLRSDDPHAPLSGLAPTFEVHVTNPLNHRDFSNRFDPAASADVVNLTYGLNFEFFRSSVLTVGLVTPVTGPRPFDTELAVLFNAFFGPTRRSLIPVTPPML